MKMPKLMMRVLSGVALLAGAAGALAQDDDDSVVAPWGELAGMHVASARACGLNEAQVAELLADLKASARKLFGSEPNFDRTFDSAVKENERLGMQALKLGTYKPTPDVCAEMKRSVHP